ncbi:hypothetical protein Rcae01_02765 [Novipirellula caenicola]|uniref:Uncharacterized protein n=1 Tax=Novipirellula caenicola TaxID=1536901 RepID=A0ABP9VRR3_9BACT
MGLLGFGGYAVSRDILMSENRIANMGSLHQPFKSPQRE